MGHVILDITTKGFSTGILFTEDLSYEIEVNLRDHKIEVITGSGTKDIPLEDGKSIQFYFREIQTILKNDGIEVDINKDPQETVDKTPFDQDTIHHHYNKDKMRDVLDWMHFVLKVESKFISEYRSRKVKPGLFWGTFDISCLINYDQMHKSFDESKVIESNAFDEHFIEFGFWFGDDKFKGTTFFVLPHPFVDESFSQDLNLLQAAYFDKNLGELILEVEGRSDETASKVVEFLQEGHKVFRDYLGWTKTEHCQVPLTMEENHIDKNCNF